MQTALNPTDTRALRAAMFDPAFRAKLRKLDPEALAAFGVAPADGDAATVAIKVVTDRADTCHMAVDTIREELTEDDLAGVQAAGCISAAARARINSMLNNSGTLHYPGMGDHISGDQRACRGCG